MPYTQNTVQLEGFPFGIFTFTYNLSGVAATDAAMGAAAGKATSWDTAAAGTVKLAGDGDAIMGRIYVAENRPSYNGGLVASVARKFKERLPTAAGYNAPAVGDRVIGGGAGTVKKATANSGAGAPTDPIVIGIPEAGFVIVEYL